MAKLWLIGDWKTGEISEANILPIVKGSDSYSIDIHAEEEVSFSVSKRDLPDAGEWKTYLKAGQRMVALVDDITGVVHFAGPIIRTSGKVKDVIQVKAAGVKEYMARRVVSSVLTGVVNNPNAGVEFKSADYQQAIKQAIQHCFTPSGTPSPPSMGVFTSTSVGEVGTKFFNSDFMKYSEAVEELQDLSPSGNEYRFEWQWTSSARTAISFTPVIAADNQPHLNADLNINLQLDTPNIKLVSFSETSELDGSANRLIAQSKTGDEETSDGSDWQAMVASGTDSEVLYDETFNAGVELTPNQMSAQVNERLNFMKNLQGLAEIEVVGGMSEWLNNLGKQLTVNGGVSVDSSGYNIVVRIIEVKVNASDEKLKIRIAPLQARYPKLPKPSNLFGGGKGFGDIGGNGPIVPRLPANAPKPSGGGGGPVIPTMPDFDIGNQFASPAPYFVATSFLNYSKPAPTYYQDKNFIYTAGPTTATKAATENFSSLNDMNDKLNNLISSNLNGPITFVREEFTSDTNSPNQTTLPFELNIETFFNGIENFIPNLETYYSQGSISFAFRAFIWTTGTEIFVWLLGVKKVSFLIADKSTFGSVILKNDLGGSSNTWVEVKRNLKYDGKIIFPSTQQSIITVEKEVLLAGYVYLEEETELEYNLIPSLGVEEIILNDEEAPIVNAKTGKMGYAILGLNSETMGIKTYGAPAWTTSVTGIIKNFYGTGHDISLYKPMLWVKTEGANDARIGLVLPPVQTHSLGSDSDKPDTNSTLMAFAYFNKNQAITEIASTTFFTFNGNSTGDRFAFTINNGMFVGSNLLATNIESRGSLRTKNGLNQFIKSNEMPIDEVGGSPRTSAGYDGFIRNYTSSIENITFLPSGNGYIYTYNNFWFAIAGSLSAKGHFNN